LSAAGRDDYLDSPAPVRLSVRRKANQSQAARIWRKT
jgi:hypothetical protein